MLSSLRRVATSPSIRTAASRNFNSTPLASSWYNPGTWGKTAAASAPVPTPGKEVSAPLMDEIKIDTESDPSKILSQLEESNDAFISSPENTLNDNNNKFNIDKNENLSLIPPFL